MNIIQSIIMNIIPSFFLLCCNVKVFILRKNMFPLSYEYSRIVHTYFVFIIYIREIIAPRFSHRNCIYHLILKA